MENIINKYYVPYDNSYCVEYTTNKNSYLLPWLGSNEFNSTKEEIKAVFTRTVSRKPTLFRRGSMSICELNHFSDCSTAPRQHLAEPYI